jgi:hypothetical protein
MAPHHRRCCHRIGSDPPRRLHGDTDVHPFDTKGDHSANIPARAQHHRTEKNRRSEVGERIVPGIDGRGSPDRAAGGNPRRRYFWGWEKTRRQREGARKKSEMVVAQRWGVFFRKLDCVDTTSRLSSAFSRARAHISTLKTLTGHANIRPCELGHGTSVSDAKLSPTQMYYGDEGALGELLKTA